MDKWKSRGVKFMDLNEFNNLFQKISDRVDASIVFNDFLNYCLQILEGKEVHFNYEYTDKEVEVFQNLFTYWQEITKDKIESDGYFDFFGTYYEEYILASNKASNKGQFYSPTEVCDLMAYAVPQNKKTVYDPACGSGRMVLSYYSINHNFKFIGEDLDEMSCKMCVLNMYAHMITGAVNWINTLTREHYKTFIIEEEMITETDTSYSLDYDLVLANPPYGVKWPGTKNYLQDVRFKEYKKLAPKSKADYAFIQHTLHYLEVNGQANILMPHGVLFRGASEGAIREYIVNHNWLDAVIGLPSNMFIGTSIPTCLLIFKKHRETEDILFIDASEEFVKENKINIIPPSSRDKIIKTYHDRSSIHKFSFSADLSFIQENDYNLNIPRYVDTFEEEPLVDLNQVVRELELNYVEEMKTDKLIKSYCDELGILSPTPELNTKTVQEDPFIREAKEIVKTLPNTVIDNPIPKPEVNKKNIDFSQSTLGDFL